MDVKTELVDIYRILQHQENALRELHQGARAILETLNLQIGNEDFRKEYATNYKLLGNGMHLRDYDHTLAVIQEKVQRLSKA